MKRWLLLACLLTPAAAHADGNYFLWGMSPGHQIDDDLERHADTDGEVGGRLALGVRSADTAAELAFFGTDLHPIGVSGSDALDSSTLSLSLGGKQFLPVDANLDLFARVALDHTWLVPWGERASGGLTGWGFDYGIGVEAGTRHDRWGIRAFLDVGQQRAILHGKGETLDVTFTAITAGVTVLWDP